MVAVMQHITNHDWMVALGLVFFEIFSAIDPIVPKGIICALPVQRDVAVMVKLDRGCEPSLSFQGRQADGNEAEC